jgi:hypothetical protein
METWFGLPGIMWLHGLSLLVLTLVVFRVARANAGILASSLAVALGLVAMGASLSPRPHMLTYIFLAATVGVWLACAQSLRTPWLLIPLTWVWAMCHGMWFTGPIVGFAICAGLALDGRGSARQLWRMLSVPVVSVLAAALTPIGPSLLLAPFAVGEVGAFITEWQPPDFRSLSPACGALLVAIVVFTWARAGRRIPWTHVLLLAVACGWILIATRTVTLGAVIVVPLAAAAIHSWLDYKPERQSISEWRLVLGSAVVALALITLLVPRASSDPSGVPSDLGPALQALPPDTPVLNDYAIGGWLRWADPEIDPLIDGLTEAYTVDELRDYATMTTVSRGWEELVAGSQADVALLPQNSPLAVALEDRLGWRVTGTDAGYAVLQSGAAVR